MNHGCPGDSGSSACCSKVLSFSRAPRISQSKFCQDKKHFGKLSETMMVIAAKTRKWAESRANGMGCGGSREGVVFAPVPLPVFVPRKFQQNIIEGVLESDPDLKVSLATY